MSFSAELANGRRIRFSLKRRDRDPHYLACFRGPDGGRKERSTKTANRLNAQDSAVALIREEYASGDVVRLAWDDAVERMIEHMEARKLRPTTIQQYELAIANLRKVFPDSEGPTDVTAAMAEEFKILRIKNVSARTVAGNLGNLSIVYGAWFRDTMRILKDNPFEAIEPPKQDKKRPRIITANEQQAFHAWLSDRWGGWRLPALFLEVKASIGCRIGELAAATTKNLRDGRIYFSSETTKGRKDRACLLAPALFKELRKAAGQTYVFEAFAEQLRGIYRDRGRPHHASRVKPFAPGRLKTWLESEAKLYFQTTGAEKFKLHNFRGSAMSAARMAGVSESDAAVAFGCSTSTMKEHYLALDAAAIGDRVFQAMREKNGEKPRPSKGNGQAGRKRPRQKKSGGEK